MENAVRENDRHQGAIRGPQSPPTGQRLQLDTRGKISARALVGTGVRARIWVEQADLDLLLNLEPAQQDAQTHPIA